MKIAGGVAYHGFAINVDPDLTMFDGIIPCGITDRAVTSMAAELEAGGGYRRGGGQRGAGVLRRDWASGGTGEIAAADRPSEATVLEPVQR